MDARTRRDAATRARRERIARGRGEDGRARARDDARGRTREAKGRPAARAMGARRTRGSGRRGTNRRGAALATALAMGLTLAVEGATSPFTSRVDLDSAISACLSADNTLATCTDSAATPVPIGSWDVTAIVDMSRLFDSGSVGSSLVNVDISLWVTSSVTDMNAMFKGQTNFNQDISTWNTSSVTDMSGMFHDASSFNQNIPTSGVQWDTSRVKFFDTMFKNAAGFNQDISSWVVSSGVDFNSMFQNAVAFNQDITGWTGASGASANNMFSGATAWINNYGPTTAGSTTTDGPASAWGKLCAANQRVVSNACQACPTGSVRAAGDNAKGVDTACACPANHYVSGGGCLACASGLFRLAGDVAPGGDTACTYTSPFTLKAELVNTIASSYCLGGAAAPTGASCTDGQGLGIANWDVSGVTDMAGLFQASSSSWTSTTFNADLSLWDTSSVTDMNNMFFGQTAFNQPIPTSGSQWDTSSVVNMNNMFNGATSFNQDIRSWVTSSVTDMGAMFENAAAFDQPIPKSGSQWDTTLVKDMSNMFFGAAAFNQDLSTWVTQSVTDMSAMFQNAPLFNYGMVTSGSVWDTSSVANFNSMFSGATSFNQDISSWNTALVTDMGAMFQSAVAFNQPIPKSGSQWDTTLVTDMSNMFGGATAFNQDIGSWVVSAVANFDSMFSGATSFNKNITGWIGAGGASANNMFSGATAWIARYEHTSNPGNSFHGPASAWTGPVPFANLAALQTAVTNCLNSAPSGACTCSPSVDCGAALYEPITNWDTSLVADMNALFQSATLFNANIGSWNTEQVTRMDNMFSGAAAFNQPIGSWNVTAVTDASFMFQGATAFVHDITGWVLSQTPQANVTSMFVNAIAWINERDRIDGSASLDGPPSAWYTPAPPPPPSPPPPPPPTCGNGVYDAAGTNPDGTLGETCEPYGNSIDNTVLVQGCDPATCAPFENWQCNDPSTIGTPDYNCTCNNPAGTYALPDVNFCARVKCVYADRCLSEGRGCAPGAGGNACDRCYTAQDIVDLGLEASLAKAGYYKTGQTCTECPGTSAGQLFAAATLVVVLAFFGFKASQVMGPQATNNLKKIIESLQFFSLSLSMDIKWPGPVLNLGKYLEAFTFSVDFLRPECVATGLNWLNIFLASVFVVPALIFFIIVFNNFRSRRRFERTVRSIHCERRDGGAMVYWIERPGRLWGIRRMFESKGGDKIVKELQRQYRFRASLRSFGVLSMTVLYLPIVRMCLQAFDCLEIDGIESTRLEHDIDIDCESTSHVTIQAAAAVMLAIVGIGMPIYVILQVRKLSNTGKLDDPQTIDAYGPFYDIYRREDVTYSHKLEIARLRQTTVRSRSIPRGSDDEDDREETTFDTETERVADEIENDIRQDIEEPNEGTSLETTDGPTDDVEQGEDFNPELGKKKVFGKGRKSKDGRLAQVLSMSKSMLQRTPSAQARERVKKMSWKDRFSVYYLSVELCQKSGVILMTSPFISASPLSGWGLVFIHWFLGIFVYICQPWRIITLSFFGFKVSNCLNKVETMAAFLQGVTPALAMIWPVKRDADGIVQESFTLEMMTGLMTAIITGLLAIRIIVFVGERVAVKRAKMDIDKEPEACIEIVREKLVEMAKKRAVVSLFALKADFDITRRKARARIEITRQAMLTRIDTLKSEMASTEGQGIDYTEQITALYEVANQMAHIVNTVVPMPPPVGPAVEERIDALEAQLSKLSVAEDERYVAARQESEPSPNAAAMHIIFKVHIIDCIVAQVNEQLEVYASAELVSDLAVLGRRHAELLSEQSAITSQFGDSELRATSDELSSSAVPLLEANERDDFEKVSSTLHHCASVIDAHAQWCMTQSELFSGLKREHPTFLPDEPPLTTECFESCIKDLKTHEKQMELVRTQCISDWLPMFKHFGCVKYLRGFAEQIRNQLSLSLNGEITPEEAKVVYDDTVAFMDGFASWCADLCGIIETSDVFNEFQPIASAMMKSLKVIQIDAKKQSMLAQKVLSAVDYALAQKSTAEAVRNNLQQALRDLTSKMEEHLAVQMDEMKNEKIALERAYEEEKVQTEEDINVLEKTFAERKATMEREFALQRDIVERLLVMKQEEKAAVAPSLNPFRRVRFEYENELASANKECLRISRALEREENVKNKQCENLLRAMQQTERQLRAQIKIHDSLMAKMEADVLDHLKKQGNVAQKRTAHDIAANKAVLASRKAIYKQQRIAAQLYVSVERETTRAQVGLTRTKLAVAKRKGLLVRTTSRLTGKSLRSKSRKKAHDENETVKDDQQEKEVEDQTAVDEKSNVTETKT